MTKKHFCYLILAVIASACSTNPYKNTEKAYDQQLKNLENQITSKEAKTIPAVSPVVIDTSYAQQLRIVKDTLSKTNSTYLQNGINTEWIGTVNFNLRKPSFVIIHHTAQDSLQQTINTFTKTKTQVSAHYIISENGKVVQMLNDYLRAWHAGNSTWGKVTDLNSCSIGIELDNNGFKPFTEAQISSLVALLTKLKKDYNIPTQNFLGHADIAPGRKQDPSALFPWKTLAEKGFGIWPDEVLEPAPFDFKIEPALRIIGYNTKNLTAAIQAFKLHYIQTDATSVLDRKTIDAIYSIYKKQVQ
ncbi:MAG: N-acetylmuramoyl-L-alanine amidase [Flavobacterium nitrogenifigens]|uniref:N-acetylmuramoyl-L-alanine amidase n=1 Tax=Flavobacterium nitrogenifigens TaxID=1617283 RepID=A0A521DLW8_9FLAO|nr:N-acetylmuramoyl-L-alanine amidase [Flavobacterium nitrogenifigens]KAF2330005.1 N-acetylmuramoyl-L-alanine amidase [Flavobacterium nitrogenifigens]MDQ8014265.1 N-acetylmuramoyl-L-alanine amidase [Flavobacterium nitrogenifigens]SMO72582.1 N-acetylmuramoyl-L-alanine amidase [Flavobacterium nitrogenifigens]